MKKLLMLTLIVFFMMTVVSFAAEEGQVCTLKEFAKVFQVMPNGGLRPTMVPESGEVEIGAEIEDDLVLMFNDFDRKNGITDTEWESGHYGILMHDFGNGPTPIFMILKDSDVENCREGGDPV